MTRPVRWGVLSTALINEQLLAGAALSPQIDVMAIGSRDWAKAARDAGRWKIPRAYGRYDVLLADPDVDAVYVPLPNGLHHEWTMRALQAGKHVLCEKPYSRRPDEVRAAFAYAEDQGLVLSEAGRVGVRGQDIDHRPARAARAPRLCRKRKRKRDR